ncbi:MAG: lactate racemase domain-containing protein [Tenuifilaceae bacterium]|jgi:nickel-dependent lactate racemase|nr:lactate racemase domain-containing protein [Tenuifilaceae bacterium]
MLYFSHGSETTDLSPEDIKKALFEVFDGMGKRKKVLAIPPDFTRFHSQAGLITSLAYENYGKAMTDILPALGTHTPMTEKEISKMFKGVPLSLFREHKWRTDIVTLGEVPADYVKEVSDNRVDYTWPAQVNKMLVNGGYDLILSPGQVVPHEVIGMANYNKNIFVGTGGAEGINKSHFLGAAYGIERILGRSNSPVRKVLNYASEHFAQHLPIVYILTVVAKNDEGKLKVRGLYIGDDHECYFKAAELSLKVNFIMLEKPLSKVVVYLDPEEFKSTWLGNKSVYRTRMAIADKGELIVLAPGLKEFGEDKQIDSLIRKYGYLTTPEILELTRKNEDLQNNLSATAHLIHGSAEDRFKITYCPGNLTEQEIKSVNFSYANLDEMMQIYNPEKLRDGYNTLPSGEEIFYISNPAIGLWASRERFKD